ALPMPATRSAMNQLRRGHLAQVLCNRWANRLRRQDFDVAEWSRLSPRAASAAIGRARSLYEHAESAARDRITGDRRARGGASTGFAAVGHSSAAWKPELVGGPSSELPSSDANIRPQRRFRLWLHKTYARL